MIEISVQRFKEFFIMVFPEISYIGENNKTVFPPCVVRETYIRTNQKWQTTYRCVFCSWQYEVEV